MSAKMERKKINEPTDNKDIVCGRLYKLLLSEDHSDVTFVVGERDLQKCFRAHRLILSAASDVFKAMFYGSLPESGKNVLIPDLHPDGFSIMLRYIYEGKVQFDSIMNIINTLAVANKYMLKDLIDICCSYLADNVTPQCACVLYETACLFDDIKLERIASAFLISRTLEVVSDENFLSAKQSTVEFILRQNTLGVYFESELFDAVLRWGKVNVKKSETTSDGNDADLRTVVQPLLPFIRFLSMTAMEFTDGPALSEVLTDIEKVSLLMNIIESGSRSLPIWMSHIIPRKTLDQCIITEAFCSVRNRSRVSSVKYVEDVFVVTKPYVLLHAIFFHTKNCLYDVSVNLDLFNLTRNYSILNCDIKTSTFEQEYRLELSNPELFCLDETCKIIISFDKFVKFQACEESPLSEKKFKSIHGLRLCILDPLSE